MTSEYHVVFLGTGVSTAVPNMHCILKGECKVCFDALENQATSKNHRNNVSILVHHQDDNGETRTLLIDVGKTFRDSVCRHFPRLKLKTVDHVFLTHDHFDATGGLDDIRDMMEFQRHYDENGVFIGYTPMNVIKIFATEKTFAVVRKQFGYIINDASFDEEAAAAAAMNVSTRRVATVQCKQIPARTTMTLGKLPVEVFPVFHGGEYVSLGFSFGPSHARVVYISDVKSVPSDTMELLQSWDIDTLIVDALCEESHTTHFSIGDAIEFAKVLQPKETYLVGMCCTVGFHEEFSAKLSEHQQQDGIFVTAAYDGLQITKNLQ